MAGRRITVHTRKAQLDRERQRRNYEQRKRASYDPRPLAQVLTQWRTQ